MVMHIWSQLPCVFTIGKALAVTKNRFIPRDRLALYEGVVAGVCVCVWGGGFEK